MSNNVSLFIKNIARTLSGIFSEVCVEQGGKMDFRNRNKVSKILSSTQDRIPSRADNCTTIKLNDAKTCPLKNIKNMFLEIIEQKMFIQLNWSVETLQCSALYWKKLNNYFTQKNNNE